MYGLPEDLCSIGDTFYKIKQNTNEIYKIRIVQIDHYPHSVYRDDRGYSYFNRTLQKTCFKTEEDAYKEILKRQNIKEKRELLKEYERELNMRFNLEDHYIIK